MCYVDLCVLLFIYSCVFHCFNVVHSWCICGNVHEQTSTSTYVHVLPIFLHAIWHKTCVVAVWHGLKAIRIIFALPPKVLRPWRQHANKNTSRFFMSASCSSLVCGQQEQNTGLFGSFCCLSVKTAWTTGASAPITSKREGGVGS